MLCLDLAQKSCDFILHLGEELRPEFSDDDFLEKLMALVLACVLEKFVENGPQLVLIRTDQVLHDRDEPLAPCDAMRADHNQQRQLVASDADDFV